MRSVSVALCCLNERRNFPTVIGRLKALGQSLGEQLSEVVVVDGGSSDGTWEFLTQAASEWKALRLLRQHPPSGYGSGYRQSVLACSGDIIITCDMDLNYDITEAVQMLSRLREADLVVANPLLDGAKVELGHSRMILTRGLTSLYRLALTGAGRTGTVFTAILRAGKAEVFQKAVPQSNGFTASAEFMMRVYLTTDARVIEMPVSVHRRGAGHSKLPKFRTTLGHLWLLGRVLAFRMGLRKEF